LGEAKRFVDLHSPQARAAAIFNHRGALAMVFG